MAKIALIADTHFGVGNDSKPLLNNQLRFFKEIFFPYIDKYEIKHVIHLGDVFDRRKYVNFATAKAVKDNVFGPLYERGVDVHVLLGNHDVYYKNTNSVNSMKELYQSEDGTYYGDMKVYETPDTISIDGRQILMLPWICEETEGISYEAIKKSEATIACGHLELANFPMYRHSISEHGMDHRIFSSFDLVFSGHFHHRSITSNIWYVGSTGQYTWSDFGDVRGFHILDTQTLEVEFISNDYSMFNVYNYDDENKTAEQMLNFPTERYSGTNVKMIVKSKNDPYLLEKMIDKFEKSDIVSLQIVEEYSLYSDGVLEGDDVDESEDTLSIILKSVESIEDADKQSAAKKLLTQIYFEAMSR